MVTQQKTKLDYDAFVIADSISNAGARLTTFSVTLPRPVLAEFNTHKLLSRNSASSRAIPVSKNLRNVIESPYIPSFGINQTGMQAKVFLEKDSDAYQQALITYLQARDYAVLGALGLLVGRNELSILQHRLNTTGTLDVELVFEIVEKYQKDLKNKTLDKSALNIHKQTVNRLLEPFSWQTIITTGTEWDNFYALRCHPDADPAILTSSVLMRKAHELSVPRLVEDGQWHLPLVQEDEFEAAQADPEFWAKVSSARCARVSYMTHDGVRDIDKDAVLFERLSGSGHMSPLEHPGTPLADVNEWSGNFKGWKQYRKFFPNEDNYGAVLAAR